MSGETGDAHSGWTVDTLRAHMQQRLDDLNVKLDERHLAQATALTAALAAQEKALDKALTAINERLHLLNELRDDVATTAEVGALEKEQANLASRMDRSEGRGTGLNTGWGYLVAAVALLATIVSVYLAIRGG
jgi:hypothetical protein